MNKPHKKHAAKENTAQENQQEPVVSENDAVQETQESDIDTAALKIKELEEQVAQLKDSYLRSQADMENLRRRTQTELEKRSKYAVSSFASDILPVADNLQRALDSIPEDDIDNPVVKNIVIGLEMTQKDLNTALAKNDIHRIESLGKIFDPNFHKVVQEVEDASVPAGTIVQEWQTGYTIGDRVLRESVVVAAKGGVQPHSIDTTV